MLKSHSFKIAATAVIVCLIAPGFLSIIFRNAPLQIFQKHLANVGSNLKEVFPQAAIFEAVKEGENVLCYKALDKGKNILGYVFKAQKKGYSSDIITLVGMDRAGKIIHIKILSQNETPGIGSRIAEIAQEGALAKSWFQEQFSGKKIDQLPTSVQAITGATISSRAVINSIQERARVIMEKMKNAR